MGIMQSKFPETHDSIIDCVEIVTNRRRPKYRSVRTIFNLDSSPSWYANEGVEDIGE